MLQEAIDLQREAVSGLLSAISLKDEITFKAPTGSGKTYMMADFMNQVLRQDEDVVFIVSSLSKGDLAEQNYEKFIEYSENKIFKNLKPYLISSETSGENGVYIPTDYNVYVLARDLYKEKSKLKQGAFVNFLTTMTGKAPLGNSKEIYLIKDECHIATKNLDDLIERYFSKVLNFSATPKLSRGQVPDVELKEFDAINAKLIKKVEYQPEDENLEDALHKFSEIKKEYINKLGINPCLIIQISNKEKADEEIENIMSSLNTSEFHNLKWMLIVDDDKKCDTNDVFKVKKIPVSKWKEYAKTNTSTIDIIIFKMIITEGWDIPRACMLYQVRDSKSKQLDEQVIGRIRRNPKLLNFEKLPDDVKELATTAYIWGLVDKETKSVKEVNLVGSKENNEVQQEIKLKVTRLKTPIELTTFDINEYFLNKKEKIINTNIFDLYEKCSKLSNDVREIYDSYVDTVDKWFEFTENIDDITSESKSAICNYEKSMEIVVDENNTPKEVSFPLISYYTETDYFENVNNWLWKRTDDNDKFSFDSEAEKEWCSILLNQAKEDDYSGNDRIGKRISIQETIDDEERSLKKYLLGKNFLPNSEIKFEYYLKGIHFSYPDFIMKDFKDRIHIFETKSLNSSKLIELNTDEYEDKIQALRACYKQASKLTGYYFYIPIKIESEWNILCMHDGKEEELSLKKFKDFLSGKIDL